MALYRGSTGQAVSDLQGLLASAGYSVANDGIYGPATEAAVRSFQISAGLTVDGIYGPQPQHALTAAVLGNAAALRPNLPTTPTLIEMPPIEVTGTVPPESPASSSFGVVVGLALAAGAFVILGGGKGGKGRGGRRRSSGRRRRRR